MPLFELRRYILFPGSSARMLERFQTLNIPLFNEHGIHLEHAWRDIEDPDAFVFVASFPDKAAREAAWADYHQDQRYVSAKKDQATIIKAIEICLFEPADGSQ